VFSLFSPYRIVRQAQQRLLFITSLKRVVRLRKRYDTEQARRGQLYLARCIERVDRGGIKDEAGEGGAAAAAGPHRSRVSREARFPRDSPRINA